jgi:hypothetical protein
VAAKKKEKPKQQDPQASIAETFERVRQRANQGDRNAQVALKTYMDGQQLWDRFGDLANHAELSFVAEVSGGEWLTSEAIKPALSEKTAIGRLGFHN